MNYPSDPAKGEIRKRLKVRILTASSVIASMAAALVAPVSTAKAAEDSQAQVAPSDEIVVTAQRREQSAQDVGIAISAVSGAQLSELKVQRGADLALIVPGVSAVSTQTGSSGSFSIRGVSQNSSAIHQEGPVALYQDEAYISNVQFQSPAFFDIQRVEVLKGPQGTLFGRNATGGLVHIVSNKPTNTPEGYVDLTYGSFNEVRVEGAISGPLSDDLSARIAVLSDRFDNTLHNTISNDYGGQDTLAIRSHIKFTPSQDLKILLTGYYSRDKTESGGRYQETPAIAILNAQGNQSDVRLLGPNETARTIVNGVATGTRPCPGCNFFGYRDPDGPGPLTAYGPLGSPGPFVSTNADHIQLEELGGTANIEWSHDNLTLVSITDYRTFKSQYVTPLAFGGVFNGVPPVQYFQGADVKQFSQELRASINLDNFRTTFGGYYLHIDGTYNTLNGPVPGGDLHEQHVVKTKSPSLFANAEFDILHNLTLIGGVRYISETQNLDLVANVLSSPTNVVASFGTFNTSVSPIAKQHFPMWSWRAGVNFKPTNDTLIYLSVNRGVKSGGFNIPTTNTVATVPFSSYPYKPEKLTAYEVGVKQTFMDGKMQLQASGYYYDYNDYQASLSINLVRSIYSLQAEIYGGELQISGRPLENLYVNLGASYLHTRAKNVTVNPQLIEDLPITYSPNWKLTGLIRYDVPIGDNKLTLSADAQYSSSYETNLFSLSALHQPGFAVVNGSVTYDLGKLSFQAFIRNITDQRYIVSANDLASSRGEVFLAYNLPRWWGVNMHYAF